jgi:hypothetical protein
MYKEVEFFSFLSNSAWLHGCKYARIDISFRLKVIEKCKLQETLQDKGKGLEALGKVSIV